MPMRLVNSGYREMQAELAQLRQAVRTDATQSAVRAAATVIRSAFYERAPVLDKKTAESTALDPGELKEGMRFSVRKLSDGFIRAVIGPRRGTGRAAHLVEYGHRLVKGGRSRVGPKGAVGAGRVIGDVPAHPFLRPGYEASVKPAFDAFVQKLRAQLKRWVH